MPPRVLRFGVAGLSRGFVLMLPTLARHPKVRLAAAADPRAEARARFAADFGGRVYDNVEDLCRDPEIDVVYVASPHQFHESHAGAAAAAGKHVLLEKPMALTLESCRAMVDAARVAGTHLVVGPSHSFDAPILLARKLIAGGAHGRVRMITALNYTDFLYRPRRPEELDTKQGGGVMFSQAVHQVDVVRLLAGGLATSVRAQAGAWDLARPTEGAYAAHLEFADGAFASLTYSGYGRFDSDEFTGWIGETGFAKDPDAYGAARNRLRHAASAADEATLKEARAYGAPESAYKSSNPMAPHHEHFGLVVVSCERADIRPTPSGVTVYGNQERRFHPVAPPSVPRAEVIDELYAAVVEGRPPLHSGAWGMASLEVCLAMIRSAAEGTAIALSHQMPVVDAA